MDRSSHLIELKGSDIKHGLKQILETLILLENDEIFSTYVKRTELVKGYIVSNSRTIPGIDYTHKKELMRKLHSISKKKFVLREYVVSVRCANKISKNYKRKNNYEVLNNNDFPLII